jgi:uncharacterized membrane protein YccC
MIALYVAFWLQLGGASSAAVTVAILAQPTRGAALAKAVNRIAATFLGATMSIIIAGLFPGDRVGTLAAFILWLCVCVFVASYFRGYRAYAAVLSGYTVAIITVATIDAPQNVFTAMTNRVATITIGILCVTLVNDLFGSPPVWRGLDRRISAICQDVRAYARAIVTGEGRPSESGDASRADHRIEGRSRYRCPRYGRRADRAAGARIADTRPVAVGNRQGAPGKCLAAPDRS